MRVLQNKPQIPKLGHSGVQPPIYSYSVYYFKQYTNIKLSIHKSKFWQQILKQNYYWFICFISLIIITEFCMPANKVKSYGGLGRLPPEDHAILEKTVGFKKNYQQIQNQMNSKGSLTKLANKLINTPKKGSSSSKKNNRTHSTIHQSPLKNDRLLLSKSIGPDQNPQKSLNRSSKRKKSNKHNKSVKKLRQSTQLIGKYSELNTDLIIQKRQLQNQILFLQQRIAHQQRRHNRAKVQANKHQIQIKKILQIYDGHCEESNALAKKINKQAIQIQPYADILKNLKRQTAKKNKEIQKTLYEVNTLQYETIPQVRVQINQEEKARNQIKGAIIPNQKMIDGLLGNRKQFEDEKCMLLLDIDDSVTKALKQ